MENRVGEVENYLPLYSYLNELNIENSCRCVLVRVLRMWEARNFKHNKDLMSVDFLIFDEKLLSQLLIQGSIHHQLLYKFRDNLREGEIFLIRDFEVFRSGIHYILTDHDYMIRFTDATILEEAVGENFLIPSEKFRLHNHNMIGYLCKVDTLAPFGANQSKRIILHICMEEGINLCLTIWDGLADSFATKFKEIDERNIIIIATSILPKSFGGKLCLSASSSTKIYLNGDFEDVKAFRVRQNVHPEIEDNFKNGESKNNDPIPKNIVLLKFCPSSPTKKSRLIIIKLFWAKKKKVKEFFCKAKITLVILRNGWNYISCLKCFRKMEKVISSLNYNNCNDLHSVGVLRFLLEVGVDDGKDCTTFVIFDKDAKQLTKTTTT
ncbi:hypothetical protein ACS0TY_021683 [Phlomoides rotata]